MGFRLCPSAAGFLIFSFLTASDEATMTLLDVYVVFFILISFYATHHPHLVMCKAHIQLFMKFLALGIDVPRHFFGFKITICVYFSQMP